MTERMRMKRNSNLSEQIKDKELVAFATKFLEAFADSAKQIRSELLRRGGEPFSIKLGPRHSLGFPGGIVEISDAALQALRGFIDRVAKFVGARAAHEKAIADFAIRQGHEYVASDAQLPHAVSALIQKVFNEASASFEYCAPNYLYNFEPAVQDITVGPVRAVRTADFAAKRKVLYPDHRAEIVPAKRFSIKFKKGPKLKFAIEMPPVCWIVDVDATIRQNVDEEAKWLIDVAVAFLRLSHDGWAGRFPHIGKVDLIRRGLHFKKV
jgi:hypothetical protein